jgi:hypothetical protein
MDEYDTSYNNHRAYNHRPCLEVIDEEPNIRAILASM